MTTWTAYRKKLLADPKVAAEYKKLEPEYQLARSVVAARLKVGLTQTELARRLGTKQPAISRLERGLSRPSLTTIRKIAKVVGGRPVTYIES